MYAIGGRLFRPYMTQDIIGTQIGGVVKNVIAIACASLWAKIWRKCPVPALVTRGFAEMSRFTLANGGKYETLMGLSGLGDLTTNLRQPQITQYVVRNGYRARKSKRMSFLPAGGRTALEGVISSESICKLAKKFNVSMPICEAVCHIIHDNAPVDQVIGALLERPFVSETI
jgi:glycerol-3-phosphate dehydrogenase (NAD(P)+)